MEKWKPVKGFENFYEVSDLGRVRRKEGKVRTGIKHNEYKTVHQRILKPHLKRNGYLSVDLSMDNIVKTISVHKLVATAFCEKPDTEEQLVVNHINCIKSDNRAENLEWVTPQRNREHAKENNRYYSANKKPVRCKQLNKAFGSSYEAAEFLNETYFGNSKQVKGMAAKIRSASIGLQKTAYGFTWEKI